MSVSVTVLPTPRSPLAGESATPVKVGVVVSICGPLCDRPLSDRLALVPAPLAIVAPFRFTLVAASEATSVFDAATV